MFKKPNILFIFPDQWRGDCLSYLKHSVVETPFLDQLAHEGITFRSAYSACPTCIATRACVATGQTPSTHGRLGYQDCVPWQYEHTLMKCLRNGGYQTLCVGKTHFYPQRAALGFEEMRLYDTQKHDKNYKSDYDTWLELVSGGLIKDTATEISTNSWVAHPWVHDEHLHPNTWTTDTAVELLERRDPTRPFFLQVGYHRPHPPLDPPLHYYQMYENKKLPSVPAGDWARENGHPIQRIDTGSGHLPDHLLNKTRKAYYAQISHIDYQIGKLLHWFNKNKITNDTFIIFASDHGELLGDHHLFRKTTPFEGSAKVPFIIKPPRQTTFTPGSKCDQPVTHMDILPTLLEEAGIDIPASVEGKSLSEAIRGTEINGRTFIHGEHAPKWQYVTDGKEKFIWQSDSGREMFFDLTNDPQELHELSDNNEYKERISLWRERLVRTLMSRPEDGLVEDGALKSGILLPKVRPTLLKQQELS